MRIVPPSWRSYPYMVDDQGKRHNLRFLACWPCLMLAFAIPSYVVPLIYRRHSAWGIPLEMLIFGLIGYGILQLCMCVVYLMAKRGCTQVFKPQGTDLNDPS